MQGEAIEDGDELKGLNLLLHWFLCVLTYMGVSFLGQDPFFSLY